MKLSTIKYMGIATLLCAWSGFAWAADGSEPAILSTGSCGTAATYTIYSDMSMVIDGSGSVYDYYVAQRGLDMEKGEIADPDSPSLAPRRAGATDNDGDLPDTDTRDSLWTKVVSVEVKSGITRIGKYAFYGCDQLTNFCVGAEAATIAETTFADVDLSACTLWVPQGCADVYANDTYWGQFGKVVETRYAIEILPFALTADTEVALTLTCPAALSHIAFDVVLPSTFGGLTNIHAALNEAEYTTATQANADGSTRVTIGRNGDNKLEAGENVAVAQLGLKYDQALGAEVYDIALQNIELTAANGIVYHADSYATEIYAGASPKMTLVEGAATYHGNYGGAAEMALLKASLPTRATVDLTQVTAMAEDMTTTAYDNVIVTNDRVAYGRTVTNTWGSICLPFAVESNEDVQFYELTNSTSESLTFEPVAMVPAHTPSVFKATASSFCVSAENDGTFAPGFASSQATVQKVQQVSDWVMNGNYIDQTIDVSMLQAYAISANEVHKVTETLNATAFRAWLQNNGTPLGARLRIDEDYTSGLEFIEQEDGAKVELFFDLNGRRLQSPKEQGIYINKGKVFFNK